MSDHEQHANGEEQIAKLLRLAGPRPRVSRERKQRVHAEVHAQWVQTVRNRQRIRAIAYVAAAAAMLVIGIYVIPRRTNVPETPRPVAIVATAQTVRGAASIGEAASVTEGTTIATGDDGTVSLDWSGVTLRLDRGTRIRLDSTRTATLEAGAIYFSSDRRTKNEIRTPLGTIHDIGTQFEVRLQSESLRVRVREGRIDLRRGDRVDVASAATELLAQKNGAIERNTIAVSGDEWRWVEGAAPLLRLDGQTIGDAVGRIAREKGLRIEWREGVDRTTRLHGDVAFTLDEALDAATAATNLSYRIENDTLKVERRR